MSKELKDRFDRVQGSFLKLRPDLITSYTQSSKEYAEIQMKIEKVRDEFRETNDFASTTKRSLTSNLVIPRKWLESENVEESKEMMTMRAQHQIRINGFDVVSEKGEEAVTKRIRSELKFQKCQYDHEKIARYILHTASACAEDILRALYAVTCPPADCVKIVSSSNVDPIDILIDFDAYPEGWGLGVSIQVPMICDVKNLKSESTMIQIRALCTHRWLITRNEEIEGGGVITLKVRSDSGAQTIILKTTLTSHIHRCSKMRM